MTARPGIRVDACSGECLPCGKMCVSPALLNGPAGMSVGVLVRPGHRHGSRPGSTTNAQVKKEVLSVAAWKEQ
jgi:hypothetical protein